MKKKFNLSEKLKEHLKLNNFGFGYNRFSLKKNIVFESANVFILSRKKFHQLVVELAPGNSLPSICNICSRSNGQLLYTLSHGSASKFFPFSIASLTAVPFSMKSMSALLELFIISGRGKKGRRKCEYLSFFPTCSIYSKRRIGMNLLRQ